MVSLTEQEQQLRMFDGGQEEGNKETANLS
jgi:hypothetical protein